MGREFELKYAATIGAQAAIRAKFGVFRKIAMETTYFDTPDGVLSAQKMTLRLRKENDAIICTLKTPLPDGSRGEWECQTTDITAGVQEVVRLGAPAKLLALAESGLIVACGARFTRLAAEIPTADGTAELALDNGVLMGGGKETPLCEVEIELKTGSDTAAKAVADAIATEFGLQEEPRSKFHRASQLAKGE